MKRWLKRMVWAGGISGTSLTLASVAIYLWWFHPPHERIADVVYGHRGEQNLLLDVFRPPQQNGAGVVVMVSGSWKSGPNGIRPFLFAPFLRRGYTVFAVRHLSQPGCLIGDIVEDAHRAVRFIRHSAATYRTSPPWASTISDSPTASKVLPSA